MDERKRSANFTNTEKIFLFRLISDKYGNILEDKKTDRASLKKREEAWISISKEFNATSPSNFFRGPEILKKLYSNKKKELKKKIADEKKEVLLTGGGTANILKVDDEVDNILLSIVNEKTVYGLKNPYDNDNSSVVVTLPNENMEDINSEHTFELFEEQTEASENLYLDSTKGDTHTPTATLNNESIQRPTSNKCTNGKFDITQEQSVSKHTPSSWKSYTPFDLKRKIDPLLNVKVSNQCKETEVTKESSTPSTNRRRPTATVKALSSSAVADKYDLLLDKRLVLVKKQLEQIEEECSLNSKKRKLEIESLELDILIKKKVKSNVSFH